MKIKKSILIILAFVFAIAPVITYAENDVTDAADTGAETAVLNDLAAVISAHCFCGRDYYSETENGHSAFDCTKCGQNMYSCTCNCWCGAETVTDTDGEYSSVTSRLCSGCGKPCILCDCRNDREAVLFAEQQRRNGEISSLNILRPKSALIPLFSLFFTLILIALGAAAVRTDFFAKKAAEIREAENNEEKTAENTAESNSVTESSVYDEKPAEERPSKNRYGGAYRLYKTIAISGKSKPQNAVFSPSDEPDLTFTKDELAVLQNVMRISPNALSPLSLPDKADRGDTLTNLIMEGIVVKTESGLKVEDAIAEYIAEIAEPQKTISFDTVFSGQYSMCTCGKNYYAVSGDDITDIRVFVNLDELCGWISEVFDIYGTEKTIPSADISFSYNEFSLYCLAQILDFKDPFEIEDIVRPDICEKLKNGLEDEGFFRTGDSFRILSKYDAVEETAAAMTEKGILFESDGRFLSSKTVDAVLSKKMIKDCIQMQKKGETEFEVLFAVRENGAAAIYDDGKEVRIISANKIPWKQYLK